MPYLGKKPIDHTDVTQSQSMTVTDDLTVDTNTLYVDSTNNRVGVGTTSPARELSIGDGTGSPNIQLLAANTGNSRLEFGDTDDSDVGEIQYLHGDNAMLFHVNASERMRIDSSGNVGIGTASPDSNLHLTDSSASTDTHVYTKLHIEDGDHSAIQFSGSTGAEQWIWFADTTGAPAGGITYYHGGPYMGFRVEGSERMRIDSSGHVYLYSTYANTTGGSANVHIGTSGELFRSTSSQNYKNTITDATHGLTELLTLRPVTYKHNSTGDVIYGGLIAEEVHAAGLTEFVEYNDDDEPDALHYGNMVALCIKAIQDLNAKVAALETENADFETRIAALEAAD